MAKVMDVMRDSELQSRRKPRAELFVGCLTARRRNGPKKAGLSISVLKSGIGNQVSVIGLITDH
jgi:hypothetical protein